MWAFATGAGLGASLIIAIGAQNAFVLSQALRRNYALSVALCCSLVDIVLIAIGVWGLGSFIKSQPRLLLAITLAGALFLLIYGAMAFRRALDPKSLKANADKGFNTLSSALLTALAVSLLNPHVYLDTVLLLGSIGGQLPGHEPIWFALGAICASFSWFFSLAIGGQYLAPVLNKPAHWRRLDIAIGLVMWLIAFGLFKNAIQLVR